MRFTANLREPEKLSASFKALTLPLSGGYEEGYTDGHAAGYTEGEAAATTAAEAANAAILSDCNAVLPDKGVETAETLEQVPQRIGEIKAEPMWIPYMVSAAGMFYNQEFPPDTELVLNMPCLHRSVVEMFQSTKNVVSVKIIAPTDATANGGLGCQGDGMFRYNYYIKKVDLSEFNSPFYSGYMMFYGCSALEEIIGELWEVGHVNNWTNAFANCSSLKEVRFKKGTIVKSIYFYASDKLSDESRRSIVDGLTDLTGSTAQTLTLHATVGGKLTEEQKEIIAAKNWTLVY